MRSFLALCTCVALLATAPFVLGMGKVPQLTGHWLDAKGAQVRQLRGSEAGPPLSARPGVKTITYEEWRRQKEDPPPGVFLVETDFVPRGLEKTLQHLGLRLRTDGNLVDSRGRPATLFYRGATFAVTPERRSEIVPPPSGGFNLQKLGAMLEGAIVPEAQAAYPYPWRCVWWNSYMLHSHSYPFAQKCHTFTSGTFAEVGGQDPNGGCDWATAPYTKIEWMRPGTFITFPESKFQFNPCVNCDRRRAEVKFTQCHIIAGAYGHPLIEGVDNLEARDGDISINWPYFWYW
jgi:hypothetical protein